MNTKAMEQLNQCEKILKSVDLGFPMTWLWTWITAKEIAYGEEELKCDLTEEQLWEKLWQDVKSGKDFSLEYGSEDNYESVRDWLIESGYVTDREEVQL